MAKKRMAWETAHYLGVQVDGEGEEGGGAFFFYTVIRRMLCKKFTKSA